MAITPSGDRIRIEVSEPIRNPADGYYYQRVRWITDSGVVLQETIHQSYAPGATTGLVDPQGGLQYFYALARILGDVAGILLLPPPWKVGLTGELIRAVMDLAKDLMGMPGDPPENPGYMTWPGTDKPWDPSTVAVPGTYGSPAQATAPFAPKHPNPLWIDPLVVNLNGTGINLTNVRDSTAYFDYTGTGFRSRTGWITPTEGILINDIHPGTNAVTADEVLGAKSGDGFVDLAALDSNGDGKIDANDAAFANLRLWVDANGNGVGDPGELISLADAGITAINLNPQSARQNINGNIVTETGTVVRSDGTTAAAVRR